MDPKIEFYDFEIVKFNKFANEFYNKAMAEENADKKEELLTMYLELMGVHKNVEEYQKEKIEIYSLLQETHVVEDKDLAKYLCYRFAFLAFAEEKGEQFLKDKEMLNAVNYWKAKMELAKVQSNLNKEKPEERSVEYVRSQSMSSLNEI